MCVYKRFLLCTWTRTRHVKGRNLYRILANWPMSRDSSVGIVTGYGLHDWMIGVRVPAGAGNFCLPHHVQTGSGAHPASYPMGTAGSFPWGLKRPGREGDYSLPSSA
jgi:hypothetical protein